MSIDATYDLIERYLSDELNAEEKASVKNRLQNDPAFYEEVEAHRIANEIIVDNSLLEIKKELENIHRKNSIKTRNRRFYLGLGILITGVIAISVFLYQRNTERNTITSNTLDPKVPQAENSSVPQPEKEGEALLKEPALDRDEKKPKAMVTPSEENKISDNSSDEKKEGSVQNKEVQNSNQATDKSEKQTISNDVSKAKLSEAESNSQNKLAPSPCEGVIVNPEFTIVNSCSGQKTGAIIFKNQLSEGLAPLKFSMDGGQTFHSFSRFNNQAAGLYSLIIMDQQGCKSEQVEARIEEENCSYVIYPSQQKYWEIPLERFDGEQVQLKIRDARTAKIVCELILPSTNSYTWQGTDQSNNPLSMGTYVYELTALTSNQIVTGQVTIIR